MVWLPMIQEHFTALRLRLQRFVVSKTETVILVELSRAEVYWIKVSEGS